MITDLISAGPNGTITSLHGDGGLGKTAIAYEAVLAASTTTYTKVAWSSARQIADDDRKQPGSRLRLGPNDVLRGLSKQLRLHIPSDTLMREAFLRGVQEIARKERLLLVIDNLESAADLRELVGLLTAEQILDVAHVVLTTRTQVNVKQVPRRIRVHERTLAGLSLADSCAFIRHIGRAVPAIADAGDERLAAIPRVVDGNPYLIKITIRQLCHRAQPLDRLLNEIRTLDEAKSRNADLAHEIREFMFSAALEQFDDAVGAQARSALLAAFCAEPPGSRLDYTNLLEDSGLSERKFADTLDAAVELSLVRSHDLNEQFSIHSLLHVYSSGRSR